LTWTSTEFEWAFYWLGEVVSNGPVMM
jgi:hypothetical protein